MSTTKSFRTARGAHGFAYGLVLLVGQLVAPTSARAGGYDVPLVNSAKHGGMGGTGISFVEGAMSLYLNPAGLGRVKKANIDVSATILKVKLRATPTFLAADQNLESSGPPIVAPFVGASGRLTDFLVIGVAAYVVAGAGGEYTYEVGDMAIKDKTELPFQESTVGLAFNIDRIGLTIGAGYRITFTRLVREFPFPIVNADLTLKGVNFKGFRAGFQWQLTDSVSIGAVYRNKITINVDQNGGMAFGTEFEHASTDITLPARAGGGLRFDVGPFASAFEFEWIFNSQNKATSLSTTPELATTIQQVFNWSDQYLVRWGAEYSFFDDQWPVRLGFIYGSKTTSSEFPNAFQPPPAPEYLLTLGTGYNHGPWQMSFAYARGWSSTVVDVDTSSFITECSNCGGNGEYKLRANHFIFDFSYNWR